MDLKITNETKHISKPAATSTMDDAKKEKLAKASRDFESLLTTMMLKNMGNSSSSGLFGNGEEDGFGGDYFESLFQQQIAQQLSNGKGLGIAQMLYKNLTGEDILPAMKKLGMNPLEKIDKINLNNSQDISPVKPSKTSSERINKYEDIINEASETFGVDKNLIKSVILTESAGNEKALSKANAKGLMQLIDGTAKDMGVQNVWNPKDNIFGGTKYLSGLLRQYDGNVKLALAGYNAGPGNVDKYNGVPPFEETQSYVARVIGYYNHLNNQTESI